MNFAIVILPASDPYHHTVFDRQFFYDCLHIRSTYLFVLYMSHKLKRPWNLENKSGTLYMFFESMETQIHSFERGLGRLSESNIY